MQPGKERVNMNSRQKGARGERELAKKLREYGFDSRRDRKENEIAAVFHRKNNCEWLVTMRLDDFMTMYSEGGWFNELL